MRHRYLKTLTLVICGFSAVHLALADEKAPGKDTSLKQEAREVGRATGNAAREVGQGTKKVSKEVGKTVVEAARETGHAFRDGAKEFKKAVKDETPKKE